MLIFLLSFAFSNLVSTNFVIERYRHNPKYLSLEQDKAAAKAIRKQAGSLISPQVNLYGSYSFYEESERALGNQETYSSYLNLSQDLFRSGGVLGAYQQVKLEYNIRDLEIFLTHQKNLQTILNLFYDYLSALKQQEALQESEKIQKEFLRVTERKSRQGNARTYELSQARAEYLSFQSRLQQVEHEIFSLEEKVKIELNLPGGEKLKFVDQSDQLVQQSELALKNPLSHYFSQAVEKRPEILIAKARLDLVNAAKKVDFSEDLPSISLNANYGYEDEKFKNLTDRDSDYFNVGLTLKIPIFSGLSSVYKRREYAAKNISAQKNILNIENEIKKDVTSSYSDLQSSAQVLKSTQSWVNEARKAFQQATKSFMVGTIDTSQLLQIQQGKERAELEYAKAKMELYKKFVKFHLSLGQDLFELKL